MMLESSSRIATIRNFLIATIKDSSSSTEVPVIPSVLSLLLMISLFSKIYSVADEFDNS
jgi:hypothetical protein